jgi:triacylglycerol esterase/lipase EstA (alpha/beta hydrolase family)
MRSSVSRLVIAALLATTLTAVTSSATASAASAAPTAISSGVNNWFCRPSAAHPNPVVLIHGLGGNGPGHWAFVAPALASQGYCVFHKTYGAPIPLLPVGGLKPVDQSARELARFIDDVLDATHATEVDLVGHSEGGFQSLYIPKVLNYGAKVESVVSLAPPTHGTDFGGWVDLADFLGIRGLVDIVLATFGCQACPDLLPGGGAVTKLTNGPIAVPGVKYTIIASRADVLVTPNETSFVREPGVTNMYVQDTCPFDPVGHIGMAFELGVFDMITNALDPASAHPVRCSIGLPF